MVRLIVVAFIGLYGYQCMTGGCGNISPDMNKLSNTDALNNKKDAAATADELLGRLDSKVKQSYKDNVNNEKVGELLGQLDSKAKQAIESVKEGLK